MAGADRRRSSPASAPVTSRTAQALSISPLHRSHRAFIRVFSSGSSHLRAAVRLGKGLTRSLAWSHPEAAASSSSWAAAWAKPGA